MKILFIDTACKMSSVHYSEGSRTARSLGEKSHSVNLLSMVNEALGSDTLGDVDVIGVTNGPGSYTGIRIGLATAKTLAWTLEKPLVTVNTLDYIAQANIPASGSAKLIVPLIDARNNRAFYSFFSAENGIVKRIADYSADDIDAIKEKAFSVSQKPIFCGDGAKNALGIENDLGNCAAAETLVKHAYENEKDKNAFVPEKADAYYMKEVHVTLKTDGKGNK